MKIRGRITGYFGSLQVPESGPPERNDTWDLWSGESRFYMAIRNREKPNCLIHLSVPTAREVLKYTLWVWEIRGAASTYNLCSDARRTTFRRQLVVSGGDAVKVEAQEGNGLLCIAIWIICPEGWVTWRSMICTSRKRKWTFIPLSIRNCIAMSNKKQEHAQNLTSSRNAVVIPGLSSNR